MPFSYNPFSKKKVDFTADTPKAPKELEERRPLAGKADDDYINRDQGTTKTEKTIIRETPEKDDLQP